MFYIELFLYFFTNKHKESFILKTTAGLNFFPSLSVALTVSNRRILLYTPHKIRLGTQISKVFIPYGVTSWRICRAWPGYRTATNLWRFYINNRVQVPPSASSQTSIPRTALKRTVLLQASSTIQRLFDLRNRRHRTCLKPGSFKNYIWPLSYRYRPTPIERRSCLILTQFSKNVRLYSTP